MEDDVVAGGRVREVEEGAWRRDVQGAGLTGD